MINQEITCKRGLRNPIVSLFTFLLLFVIFNADFNSNAILWWGIVGSFIIICLVAEKDFYIDKKYMLWMTAFISFCCLSCLWAESVDLVFVTLKTMMVHFVLLFFLRSLIRNKEDLNILLKILVAVCVVNAFYLLLTNFSSLSSINMDRLGTEGTWNANSIGLMMAIAVITLFYLFKQSVNKTTKVVIALITLALLVVTFLTGSRTAFLMVLLGIAVYLVLASRKRKRLIMLSVILMFVVLAYILVMNEPHLYNILGIRIEGLLAKVLGTGKVDSSTELRFEYLNNGMEVFKDNILIGCGIDCFRVLNADMTGGRFAYAHNNYVELLADIGLIGTLIYYTGYIIIARELLKKRKGDREITKLLLSVFVLIPIVEFACVSYNDFLFKLILMCCFAWVNIKERQKDENNGKD